MKTAGMLIDTVDLTDKVKRALTLNGVAVLYKTQGGMTEISLPVNKASRAARILDKMIDFGETSASEVLVDYTV